MLREERASTTVRLAEGIEERDHQCACNVEQIATEADLEAALTAARQRAEQAEALAAERQRWIDDAVAGCAKRECSTRDRRLRESEQRAETLRAALARYGQHPERCAGINTLQPCDCGLDAALAQQPTAGGKEQA